MAPLTELQKAIYANQTAALELQTAQRAVKVLLNARQDLLKRVKAQGQAKGFQQATLANLEGVISSIPQAITQSMNLDGLATEGFNQGKSLVTEVGKGFRDFEGRLAGFNPTLDLNSYGHEKDATVQQIRGITDQLKGKIKEQVEISLALGEGESEAINRVFSLQRGDGTAAPFRTAKNGVERVTRTTANSLVNAGKNEAYKAYSSNFPEFGILVEWVNVSDSRTSQVCLGLVGQRRIPGEPFSFGGAYPPAHPFCRSTIIPVMDPNGAKENTIEPKPIEPVLVSPIPALPPKKAQPKNTPRKPIGNFKDRLEDGKLIARNILGPTVVEDFARDFQSMASARKELRALTGAKAKRDVVAKKYGEVVEIRELLKSNVQKILDDVKSKNAAKVTGFNSSKDTNGQQFITWTDTKTRVVKEVVIDRSTLDHPEASKLGDVIMEGVKIWGGLGADKYRFVYLDQSGQKGVDRGRGWANHYTKQINVGDKTGGDLLRTVIHEIGHVVEIETPGASRQNRDWIASKATGPLESLNKLTKTNKYKPSEYAYPGDFYVPYVSKYYFSGDTEVVSMGAQELLDVESAGLLLAKAPDQFYLALSYLSGEP